MYEIYKCAVCRTEFSTPEELRQHRMDMHKGQSREVEIGISTENTKL